MIIPSYFLPNRTTKVRATTKPAVSLDKADTGNDSAKQEGVQVVKAQEKRQGEDRRKRHIKPLLDTRTGRDRRYSATRPSIDIKA